MQTIVRQVHKILLKTKKTIATAESCTGGLASSLLTHLPGSSGYYILGVIAYNNKVKVKLLKIPSRLIAKKGAVSKEVALKMSLNIRKLYGTDYGIGITGIAGPGGGSVKKPLGTVFISASSKNKTLCKEFHFTGSRALIRKKAALKSLELLYALLHRD